MNVTIDASLAGRVRLGVVSIEGVGVREADDALAAEIAAEGERWRTRHPGASSGDVAATADARELYKALGIDPTKTRPSSEALLRRVLKGEALYRVNTLVDALNLCSLREQLSFGLYDLAQVKPPVVLRRGGAGEGYEGIRKGRVNVEGRPVLVDAEGPFGNPTSDSLRTSISLGATRALVVGYAPAGFTPARLAAIMERTRDTLVRFCGGAAGDVSLAP